MFAPPQIDFLDQDRLHLQHGPIDLVIKAAGLAGSNDARHQAYDAAITRFETILPELTRELDRLRRPLEPARMPASPVGKRMAAALAPFTGTFVTPMAAVAGAVADEILDVMRKAAPLAKAYVNNGGDIAVWAAPEETLTIAMVDDLADAYQTGATPHQLEINGEDDIGGVATSGWRGRSFSLGIADMVTVLAENAASADVAATMIGNVVNVSSPAVKRARADTLDADSDLGKQLVTTGVGDLSRDEIGLALEAGRNLAEALCHKGVIVSAAIGLAGYVETVDNDVIHRRAGLKDRRRAGVFEPA